MTQIPRSGIIVYAKNIKALAHFYQEMFAMNILKQRDDLISLGHKDFNVVIHTPPFALPDHHFNTVKMFLTVDSLDEARKQVVELGGQALEGEWSNPFFTLCNIADPEGNHIQIRAFKN